MNLIPLLFICMRMYAFINYREIAYFLQTFSNMLEARKKNPGKTQVVLMDKAAVIFLIYLAFDIGFLLYCMYLMYHPETWSPGCLLLLISAMEAYAVRMRISGTYEVDPQGFAYGSLWFRYLMTGMSMFILLKLFQDV